MRFNIIAFGFLIIIFVLSCRNANEGTHTKNYKIDTTETGQKFKNKIPGRKRNSIIKELQGSWKEPDYPFGVAQFKDTLVKFIEEGVIEAPQFRKYTIAKECPFDVNNIKDVGSDEIILVVLEAGTCEKLRISNDTLSLSGYSTHTEEDYRRFYKKE